MLTLAQRAAILVGVSGAILVLTACGVGGSEATDTGSPVVQITDPKDGDSVSVPVRISASAGDDIGVVSVRFFADSVQIAEDFTAPYNAIWTGSTKTKGDHTLSAEARDAAGNKSFVSIRVSIIGGGAQ